MSQRLVQIYTSREADSAVREAIAEAKPIWTAEQACADGAIRHEMLFELGHEQPVLDRMQQLCCGLEARVVVLPVEVSLPAPAPEPEPAADSKKAPTGRVSREELLADVSRAAKIDGSYVATVVLSTVVVAIGLVRSSPAVVIGGMVIAPLLGPNIALSLAATLADRALAIRAIKTNLVGLTLSLGIALAVGLCFGVATGADGTIWSEEIRSRTAPHLLDLPLALAAGVAGTLSFTTRVRSSLVGVMVAVALMPPLVVFGMCLAAGRGTDAERALVLLMANVVGVNLAAVVTFLLQAIRPRNWWDVERSRKVVRTAILVLLVAVAAIAMHLFLQLPDA